MQCHAVQQQQRSTTAAQQQQNIMFHSVMTAPVAAPGLR